MKILFIGAHIDDVTLSCGGSISRYIQEGHAVTVVTLSHVYECVDLSDEFRSDMHTLGVTNYIILDHKTRYFQRQQILDQFFQWTYFDIVFTHSPNDFHNDHAIVGRESLRAFKHTNIITYTGSWNTRNQVKNYFVKLDLGQCLKKIEALSCYASQKDRPYMKDQVIWSEMEVNGLMCNSKFAEAFEVVNMIL